MNTKRLIIIENNAAGTGKTTIARALAHYLKIRGITPTELLFAPAEDEVSASQIWVDAGEPSTLLPHLGLDGSGIVLLEIATGSTGLFHNFYERRRLYDWLFASGVEAVVALPLTRGEESHKAVTSAAEVYSDNVSYVLFRPEGGGSARDGKNSWGQSYAAHVMCLFDAATGKIPEASGEFVRAFLKADANLADALPQEGSPDARGEGCQEWLRRVGAVIHTLRWHLFGAAARNFPKTGRAVAAK